MRIYRMRLGEVLKIFGAVSIGYAIRLFMDLSVLDNTCPECPPCHVTHLPVNNQPAAVTIKEDFQPKSMYEVLRWAYFNEKYLFENLDDDPRIGLIGSFKFDVQDVLQQALDFVNKDSDEEYRLFNLLNGYRRVDPAKGAEYILDLELEKVDEISTVIDRKLLYLVRPFHNLQLLSRKFGKTNQNVNFIIPLSKVTDRLKDFMANYEKICLKTKEYTSLLAVLFPGTTDDGRRQVEQVKGLFYKYQKQYPEAVISYIETQGEFSRAAGLDIGAKQFSAESLLFFCDVDVDFDAAFLDRCRHNSVLGEQAYYPIVFSQYNPELVYQGSAKIPKETSKDIHKHNGFWIHYGYGMVCLHNQDYRAVGGFDLSIRGWGGEDTDLYERHIKLTKNFNVFRAVDPALIHRYHSKSCDPKLSPNQYRMCIGSLSESIGTKSQLAIKLLGLKQKQ